MKSDRLDYYRNQLRGVAVADLGRAAWAVLLEATQEAEREERESGSPVTDWSEYYAWVSEIHRAPSFDFAVIPDVIDGNEEANDALLREWPWQARHAYIGAPVWHMHESITRLERLAQEWPRVCIGSSGQYATVGNHRWWGRMAEAMNAVTDGEGLPITKLHGLRMLNPEVYTRLPLSSADSTNIAQNIGIDSAWRGTYVPTNKDVRALVMRERIEANQSAKNWARQAVQLEIAA
ncbi:hypothetical protein PTW32_11005 [Dechloromonas agitata]|uniref:hypothetical protein n=1 Tax=Dechloromonas agitata TaxID=73030 RepID=UPI00237DB26D|nr:hypothetical protein [Dechloromonas agitata]MDE1545949.1 hypothetical protein [Dechloromonas agitata]